jgi:hypothetical protein
MQKLTTEQAVVITGFTGVMSCKFADFQLDVERRMGRPVMTHEFAFNADEVKELYRADFLTMVGAE